MDRARPATCVGGPGGDRPGSLFRFRFRTPELEITDQFAVLRPPGPTRLPVA